ncbi:RloB-like protein [uncultured archaeon]|nr:RloB-like protein [uncultured archaeon]
MGGYGRRKKGRRETKRVFVIVCEGGETEPIYFNRYKERGLNLTIEVPKNKYTDPVNLAKFAKEYIKKGKQGEKERFDFKKGDKIWCVFDCDENPNEKISEACKIAGKDVIMCLSNPSFELWYLLHFVRIQSKLWRDEVNDRLKKYIRDYDKSEDVYDLLKKYRPVAIENAKNLNKKHEKTGTELICVESNPSTQVYAIVEEILKITANAP